jgi:O-antigen/teichoic acid export membrane protein
MSPSEYGEYALLIAVTSLLNVFFFQWLCTSVGRFWKSEAEADKIILSTAIAGYVFLVIFTGVAGLVTSVLSNLSKSFIVLVVALAWSQAWFELSLKVANASLSPVKYGAIASIKSICSLGGGWLMYTMGFGVVGVLFALLIVQFLTPILFSKTLLSVSISVYDKELLREFLRYGGPLTFTLLLVIVIDSSDRFFLNYFLGASAVGAYSPAYDFAQQSLGMLMSVVHLAAFPLVRNAFDTDSQLIVENQIRKNLSLLLIIALPATFGSMTLAENISYVLVGDEFRNAATRIIPVIALAIFASGLRTFYVDYSFHLTKKLHYQVIVTAIAAFCNVILNIVWIPRYGLLGAAYSTLAAFIVALAVAIYFGRQAYRLPRLPSAVYQISICAALMVAVLLPISSWRGVLALIAQTGIGCFVYAAALISLNVWGVRKRIVAILLCKNACN